MLYPRFMRIELPVGGEEKIIIKMFYAPCTLHCPNVSLALVALTLARMSNINIT